MPERMVVLKYIASEYLNHRKHGKARQVSLQREIDNLRAMSDIKQAMSLYEEMKFDDGDVVLVTEYANGCDFWELLYQKRK